MSALLCEMVGVPLLARCSCMPFVEHEGRIRAPSFPTSLLFCLSRNTSVHECKAAGDRDGHIVSDEHFTRSYRCKTPRIYTPIVHVAFVPSCMHTPSTTCGVPLGLRFSFPHILLRALVPRFTACRSVFACQPKIAGIVQYSWTSE